MRLFYVLVSSFQKGREIQILMIISVVRRCESKGESLNLHRTYKRYKGKRLRELVTYESLHT